MPYSSKSWIFSGQKWKSLSCVQLFATPWTYIVHGILQARLLEWVAFLCSRGSSQPRDQIQVSLIKGTFFISWAKGKPKNTGVGSLSLLHQIFLTQESNWGLLHLKADSFRGQTRLRLGFTTRIWVSSGNFYKPHQKLFSWSWKWGNNLQSKRYYINNNVYKATGTASGSEQVLRKYNLYFLKRQLTKYKNQQFWRWNDPFTGFLPRTENTSRLMIELKAQINLR